jgi:hypothetical protein
VFSTLWLPKTEKIYLYLNQSYELVVLCPAFRRKNFIICSSIADLPSPSAASASPTCAPVRVWVLRWRRTSSVGTGTGYRKHLYAHHAHGVRERWMNPAAATPDPTTPTHNQDDNPIPLQWKGKKGRGRGQQYLWHGRGRATKRSRREVWELPSADAATALGGRSPRPTRPARPCWGCRSRVAFHDDERVGRCVRHERMARMTALLRGWGRGQSEDYGREGLILPSRGRAWFPRVSIWAITGSTVPPAHTSPCGSHGEETERRHQQFYVRNPFLFFIFSHHSTSTFIYSFPLVYLHQESLVILYFLCTLPPPAHVGSWDQFYIRNHFLFFVFFAPFHLHVYILFPSCTFASGILGYSFFSHLSTSCARWVTGSHGVKRRWGEGNCCTIPLS